MGNSESGCSNSSLSQSLANMSLAPKRKILFYGDSLAEGYSVTPCERYTAVFNRYVEEHKLNFVVLNAGKNGDSIKVTSERLKVTMENQKPDICVMCLGGNDYLEERWRDVPTVKKELSDLINIVRSRGIQLVLVGIIPTISDTLLSIAKTHNAIKERLPFFMMYEEVAKEYDLIFIRSIFEGIPLEDSNKLIAKVREGGFDPKSIYKSEYFNDAVHPSAKAHSIIGFKLFVALKPHMLRCEERLNKKHIDQLSSLDPRVQESDHPDKI